MVVTNKISSGKEEASLFTRSRLILNRFEGIKQVPGNAYNQSFTLVFNQLIKALALKGQPIVSWRKPDQEHLGYLVRPNRMSHSPRERAAVGIINSGLVRRLTIVLEDSSALMISGYQPAELFNGTVLPIRGSNETVYSVKTLGLPDEEGNRTPNQTIAFDELGLVYASLERRTRSLHTKKPEYLEFLASHILDLAEQQLVS